MILSRLGNKKRIANDIIQYFPPHDTFIDLFFGAGGMFFSKPLSKNNICNDIDDDVFNLYTVIQSHKDDFIKEIELMPVNESLFKYWKSNKETDPIKKAVRFIKLSNFSYLGKGDMLLFGQQSNINIKNKIFKNIENTIDFLNHAKFMCQDFRKVLPKISLPKKEDVFIYADPPYLGTTNNYSSSFTETDTKDLFSILVESDIRFAISEFDSPMVLDLANNYKLNIITIGERRNLKNLRTEILITNYQRRQMQLFT